MPIRRLIAYAAVAAILTTLSVNRAAGASRHYDIGDRLPAVRLTALDGTKQIVSFERPTIVILWATWSPKSLTALGELLRNAPQGGVRWQVIPLNVDGPHVSSSNAAAVDSAARASGWNGPILYDDGYVAMDSWGVLGVPTVVFTGLGGAIDEIEHDWTPVLRDRLFSQYFGAITDSFPGVMTMPASRKCLDQSATARRLWRIGRSSDARNTMQRAVDSCVGIPRDVARLSNWISNSGDSLKLRAQIADMLQHANQNAWTFCARGALERRRGNREAAQELCYDALSQDSTFVPAWSLLAECSWESGDSLTAQAAYNRARSLNRMDARVLRTGALLAQARGEEREAARLMQAAVEARLRQRRR